KQVVADNELGGLIGALNGEYITPGPGGDPIRNPDVLPTGKNMHALDPQSIPTKAAVDCAMVVVDRLLERLSQEQGGTYPETVAFTLWGTDNIKTYGETLGAADADVGRMFLVIAATGGLPLPTTQKRLRKTWRNVTRLSCQTPFASVGAPDRCPGESLAQVLCLAGVRPIADSIGRVNKLELIPLEELGRPRVDVVVSCSGVFRDLFINQMNLLDRGVSAMSDHTTTLRMNVV
ncbi:unnamed protein product, partial [Scytosiphon promiscuus]